MKKLFFLLFSFAVLHCDAQRKKTKVNLQDTVLVYDNLHIPIIMENPEDTAVMFFNLGDLRDIKVTVGTVKTINKGAKGARTDLRFRKIDGKWTLKDYKFYVVLTEN